MNTIRRPSFDPYLVLFPKKKTDQKRAFRFPLRRSHINNPLGINKMLSGHMRKLLDILIPVKNGEMLQIDGYRWLNDKHRLFPLYDKTHDHPDEDLLDIYEPRLSYIRHLIETLLSVVEFESDSQPVPINGFRLKHPEQWLCRNVGFIDILAQAATQCNLNCRFCYNKGCPPVFKTKPYPSADGCQEILARIDLYQPEHKLGITPLTGSPCEALTHPDIDLILKSFRQKSKELIRIPTNGSLLTDDAINFLSGLAPLFIDISLNTASPARRTWLMRDPNPQTALSSLAKLKNHEIPFSVVIVPWPFPSQEEMLSDLKETIRFAEKFNPTVIQISLPGYSKFFSKKPLFDHDLIWNSIKNTILKLRSSIDCPIILRPGLFEEYTDPDRVNAARSIGIIRNSPMYWAGFKPGDRIISINGLKVKNRCQARSLLSTIHQSELKKMEVDIERNGQSVKLDVNLKNYSYPFDYSSCPYLGVVFPSAGVPISWVEKLDQTIRHHQSQEVLLLSSKLVLPTLKKHIQDYFFCSDVRLNFRIPNNRYMGGNIFMGDLLTVEDFIASVQNFLAEGHDPPDLIVLPASPFHLSGWGRDLTGKVYLEIERRLGIHVVLIECSPIFD